MRPRRKLFTRHLDGKLATQLRKTKSTANDRDGRRCVRCWLLGDLTTTRLESHHVVPVEVGHRSKLCDTLSNLITLCHSCHMTVEPMITSRKAAWKEFLPVAYAYLSQFGYKQYLLRRYYRPGGRYDTVAFGIGKLREQVFGRLA